MSLARLSFLSMLIFWGGASSLWARQYTYTVSPVAAGATYSEQAGPGFFHGYGTIGYWDSSGVKIFTYWEKYEIPEFSQNEWIFAVLLNVDVSAQHAGPDYPAGILLNRVEDDSWTTSTITNDWPVSASPQLSNRGTSGPAYGLVQTDITSWMDDPCEGPGQVLSIRYTGNTAGGVRGCLLNPGNMPTLTIITDDDPQAVLNWNRGHDLLMKYGLQIQAQVFPGSMPTGIINQARWAQSNFTTVNLHWGYDPNCLGAAPGIPWGRWIGYGDVAENEIPYYSNMVSIQYGDEQDVGNPTQRTAAASALAYWRQWHPEILAFTNQTTNVAVQPSDVEMQDYMAEARPDMLMQDQYPFDGTFNNLRSFYSNLERYRELGNAGYDANDTRPIPTGMYLQTYPWENHMPSESEIRLNQFACWVFGCKFVSAFTYNSPATTGEYAWKALFNSYDDSDPKPQFSYIAETNRQSRNLGPALVRLLCTETYMLAKQITIPNRVKAWDPADAANDPYITGINSSYDTIIGYFKALDESFDGPDYSDEWYFMIVNGRSGSTASAAATQATIIINFDFGDSGITGLQRLSRLTGLVENVPLTSISGSQYQLSLTLDGGTGDLFKFNTGAPFIDGPLFCGNPGSEFLTGDFSGPNQEPDCQVNNYDLSTMASEWLQKIPDPDATFEHVIEPVLFGCVLENGTGLYSGSGLVGYWITDAVHYFDSWAKYDIPVFTDEEIIEVLLTTDVIGQYNPNYPCGVVLHRATDDSWTASTISYSAPVVADSEKVNRSIFDPVEKAYGPMSTDITSYVQAEGEGPGHLLTVRFWNWYSGARGCYFGPPALTITTMYKPEFRLKLYADVAGASGEADNRVDLLDFAVLSSDWMKCTDPALEECDPYWRD